MSSVESICRFKLTSFWFLIISLLFLSLSILIPGFILRFTTNKNLIPYSKIQLCKSSPDTPYKYLGTDKPCTYPYGETVTSPQTYNYYNLVNNARVNTENIDNSEEITWTMAFLLPRVMKGKSEVNLEITVNGIAKNENNDHNISYTSYHKGYIYNLRSVQFLTTYNYLEHSSFIRTLETISLDPITNIRCITPQHLDSDKDILGGCIDQLDHSYDLVLLDTINGGDTDNNVDFTRPVNISVNILSLISISSIKSDDITSIDFFFTIIPSSTYLSELQTNGIVLICIGFSIIACILGVLMYYFLCIPLDNYNNSDDNFPYD